MTFSFDSWHIHLKKHGIVKSFFGQWHFGKHLPVATREGQLDSEQWNKLLWKASLNTNEQSLQWQLGGWGLLCVCFHFVPNFYHWVIHYITLANLFEFSFMIRVMGTHLSEMFGDLIMFQKHLEHESLVHY